ncbi:protealysin inhibitor emfourin [Agreia bicolorata]|uniref:protealysin inhibitor emfourin n=1 Tax=Agreia bicolorata TaxID=110935 RepID=UPI000695ED65|nr:protealysin inhibitor emfourin [Agreia bicolorata]
MNITVVRTGGFAGLRRIWRVEIDTASESALDEWSQILDACPWNEAIDLDGDGVPDRFVFVITVESPPDASAAASDAVDSELRATLPETRVVGPWKQLVNRVQSDDRADI